MASLAAAVALSPGRDSSARETSAPGDCVWREGSVKRERVWRVNMTARLRGKGRPAPVYSEFIPNHILCVRWFRATSVRDLGLLELEHQYVFVRFLMVRGG